MDFNLSIPRIKSSKLLFILFLFSNLIAILGLFVETYNRYFRGVSTPFLTISLGFILLSFFFVVRRYVLYVFLGVLTIVFLVVCLKFGLWENFHRPAWVYSYANWSLETKTGRIRLTKPLGQYPPTSGAYIACHFSLTSWQSYLDTQPTLCTAFDEHRRLLMYLNDNETEQGILREFQLNQFQVDRKSILGEPLDRSATRIAFTRSTKTWWPRYQVKAIYQVFEREISPGQTRVIESFARNPQGNLKSFTESSLLNLTSKDVFAVYNEVGILVEIPRMAKRSFAFPAKVDAQRFSELTLPKNIQPGISL